MNLNQLQQGLEQAFYTEQHRIVFWYDAEQSFSEEVKALNLGDVQILNMAEESSLAIKLKLELQDQQGKYLLYFPSAEPETEKDWLLDIKLYSRSFYADRFSIIFNELGLQQQSLREHLAKREEFLKAKARLSTLKRYIQPDADAQDLDMAMIAAVVKADSAELMHIVLALADEMVQQNLALEVNPESFAELEKFQLVPALVTALQAEIGYPASVEELNGEAPFKLGTFFIRLMSTGFCESLGDIPLWAQELVMSSVSSRATARAFCHAGETAPNTTQPSIHSPRPWPMHCDPGEGRGFDLGQLLDVMTFEVIEQKSLLIWPVISLQ